MRRVRALVIAVLSAFLAASAVYFLVVRPKIKGWGVDPAEAELDMPGDELIPEASHTETRGITIDAPVASVWPWLVQMGYERAGWYSYDAMDNRGRSSDVIRPELQALAEGDIMPTHPGGGFVVRMVQPERALVLYIDTDLVRSQAEQAQAEGRSELPTPGLKASGAMMGASYPEFAASWAFLLQPLDGDRTRLIERFRAQTPGSGPASAVMGEIMGTGIVLMTRKQMLGIKERVEGAGQVPEQAGQTPEMEVTPA